MQPNRLGRILGIGTRVAAGKLRDGTVRAAAAMERASSTAPAAPVSATRPAASSGSVASGSVAAPSLRATQPPLAARANVPSSSALAEGGHRFARGAGRFSAAMWKPFAHASGILWLQITGLFFAFFAVGFAAHSWQLYKAAGWRDHHLPLYLAFAVLFCWFAVSSFWRASRKQKRS